MKIIILLLTLIATSVLSAPAQNMVASEATKHIGETVTICGKISGGRYFEKNGKTLLNMGAAYPNHSLTIVIEAADRKKFSVKTEDFYTNKEVCIKGEIRDFKGKPEIQVTEVSQIVVNDPPAKQ